ncbi:hypothetical protein GGF40_002728 [Coemansia sp. RSA 1286]|nr:hypothetical protein GGF40_002728 [Coemansia sp. RSA 1286]
MSQGSWDNDSDYRVFNPGKYAMRQLGRSVSRKTRQLLQPTQTTHKDGQDPQTADMIDGTDRQPAQLSGQSTGIAADDGSHRQLSTADTPVYKRGPPIPSGIHRRSISFDNLVVFPDSVQRRSTEPPPSAVQVSPVDLRLPSSSTWNSGTVTTKAALQRSASFEDGTERIRDNSGRRKWLANLAHPLSTTIDSEYHAQSISNETQSAGNGQPRGAPASSSANHILANITRAWSSTNNNSNNSRGTGRDRAQHRRNQESFSGPAQLDVSTNMTNSLPSIASDSGQAQNHGLWAGEEGLAIGPQHPEALHVTFQQHSQRGTIASGRDAGMSAGSHMQQRALPHDSPAIAPSMPLSSGLFRRPSAQERSQQAGRTPSQRRRGNIARVIGTISRRINRMRSNRSASQPATPAEMRRSVIESARQNMVLMPTAAGHDFYRFLVNPEEPVSDRDSLQPDSPTILRNPSGRRNKHRRNPTFPSQSFNDFKESIMGDGRALADRDSAYSSSSSQLPAANAAPANDSLARMQASLRQGIPEIISIAIEPSSPANVNTSSDSAYTAPEHTLSAVLAIANIESGGAHEPPERLTNQGHDGSISRLVQDKLESDFMDRVRVSTRLTKDPHSAVLAAEASVAAPDPSRYMRNQDSVRRFVDDVRAARQNSERRKQEADMQRQTLLNHQAALDAAVYIYERQLKQQSMASSRPSPQQPHVRMHEPTLTPTPMQTPRLDNTPSVASSSSVEAAGCGSRALATVLPMRRRKDRRRQSEAPHGRDAAVRDAPGRRRATVFGVFCGASDSASTLPFNSIDGHRPGAQAPPPVPSKATKATARVIKRKARKAAATAYVNKDLPPLPPPPPSFRPTVVPVSDSEADQSDGEHAGDHVTEPEPEPETFSVPVIDGTRSPLHRSQSFSHFESNPRIEFPDRRWTRDHIPDPWQSHAETAAFVRQQQYQHQYQHLLPPAFAGIRPGANSVQEWESNSSSAVAQRGSNSSSAVAQRGRPGGFFAGVISRLSSSHSRNKSSGEPSIHSDQRVAVVSETPVGGWRKIARGLHQRRHTLGNGDLRVDISAPIRPASQVPAPNVDLHVSGEPLSAEIYAGIAVTAAENARSSGSRRMYSEMLQSLRNDQPESDKESVISDNGMLARYTRNGWTDSEQSSRLSLSISHGSKAASGSTVNSASAMASVPALEIRRRSVDVDGWRDSAITGMLTQVSAATPSQAKVAFEDLATMPQRTPDTKRMSDSRGLGIQVKTHSHNNLPLISVNSVEVGANDQGAQLLDVDQFRRAIRFKTQVKASAAAARMSSVAMDTITARDRLSELRFSHGKGKNARSMPQSKDASRVVSSDGSFADLLANANSELGHHYRMPELSDLDEYSPGLFDLEDAGLPFPANEKLRQLENAVLFGGLRARPITAESGGVMDSPVSEAGTGRTQILDFSATDIREGAPPGTRYRRPSARPEIKDVRGILWAGDPTTVTATVTATATGTATAIATAAASAELDTGTTAARELEKSESPETLHNPERSLVDSSSAVAGKKTSKFATISALDKASLQQLLETGQLSGIAAGSASPVTLNPLLLAKLVRTSPDPRSLIYDAASQFGSMRSHASPGSEKAAIDDDSQDQAVAQEVKSAPLTSHAATQSADEPYASVAVDDPSGHQMPNSRSGKDITGSNLAGTGGMADGQERPTRGPSRNTSAYLDSDVLAKASVLAMLAGESPAIAARKLSNRALAAAALESGNAASSSRFSDSTGQNSKSVGPENRRVSLHEYVEQQRLPPSSKAIQVGHEQLNFRVSLLDRKSPAFNRKARSASLPPPQPNFGIFTSAAAAAAVAGGEMLHSPGALSLLDKSAQIEGAVPHQRARSFYESPPLVQALLQPDLYSPESQMHPWPPGSSKRGESSSAGEDLVERALFTQLLGDGAAVPPLSARIVRKQSAASADTHSVAPIFDPEVDTGENGVPESVLRAYLAGDMTAIERFFEHIMRITAPSSIYDEEISEDGDWAYGLEGPPPEVLAQREAAAISADRGKQGGGHNTNESREVPGMQDASAEASRIMAYSSCARGEAYASNTSVPVRVTGPPVPLMPETGRDAEDTAMALPRIPIGSSQNTRLERSLGPMVGGDRDFCQAEAVSVDVVAEEPVRKIALPRSQLSRLKHTDSQQSPHASRSASRQSNGSNMSVGRGRSASGSAPPVGDFDVSDQLWRGETSTPATNSQPQQQQPQQPIPGSDHQRQHQQPSHAETALCFSPGRMREHHRNRRDSEVSQRMPVMTQPRTSKGQEKQMLMARLRVLEGIMQKSAIEESRLQPPEVLRRPRLVEDMESMASIYSSSMEMDYDRIHRELSAKEHSRGHTSSRHRSHEPNVHRSNTRSRTEVLERLKKGSQARALSPLRASIYDRQYAAHEDSADKSASALAESRYQSTTAQAGSMPMDPRLSSRNVQQSSSVVSGVSGIAYCARTKGSIKIEIVDESVSSAGSHLQGGTVMPSGRRAGVPFQRPNRFHRTAKILS